MTRSVCRRITLGLIGWLVSHSSALAIDAARYVIVPTNAASIDIERDHYSVSFLHGWVSDKDSFFESLFSDKKDGVIQITLVNKFTEGDPIISENAAVLRNLKANTRRPIGQALQLLDQVPGDVDTRITIRIALHREDTISTVIGSLEESRAALPADIFAGPWIGYSKAVSSVLTRLFGTSSAAYPFYWTGDMRINDVLDSNGKMKEHYIVLVSPQADNDQRFAHLNSTNLKYDQVNRRVTYEGKPLTDWSYVVLRVGKGRPVSVDKELYGSSAPWAVLGRSQFLTIPVPDANVEQITATAQGLVSQLGNELALLIAERKFSRRDRAMAIQTFAERSIAAIKGACKRIKVPDTECPIWSLEQFQSSSSEAFGYDKKTTIEIAKESLKLNASITTLEALFSSHQANVQPHPLMRQYVRPPLADPRM